ncbi:MAG: APC family permease [Candidatus Nanopelagicales bacterium]|nr:APC family permease [Candidatus Nanopelagicales bacterium]
MAILTTSIKRLLVGRALRSDKLGDTLLPKRVALPVFASDALSSNAYATQEILLVLSVSGIAYINSSLWVAFAVATVMGVVVMSYRQNVHAYPSGGGDYEVVTTNLGRKPGLVVASALLVDYVMTVAVSIAAAKDNIASAFPYFSNHGVVLAVVLIAILTVLNLRGAKESGTLFAIPTYAFIFSILIMVGWAGFQLMQGVELKAESADWSITAEQSFTGFALIFLFARAFSSGCTALTGVEAISNGVPAFKKPKSKNAATTLLLLGTISSAMFLSITYLAMKTGVKVAEHSEDLIGLPTGQQQKTVIVQIAQASFGSFTLGTLIIAAATALILVLAANTAYNGFPVLASILANDRFLPRQLHNRGDRLAFSNGILFLATAAIIMVYAFDASVTKLIQLYILGVFTSFTLGQLGMIKHWTRNIKNTSDKDLISKMKRSRIINSIGFVMTGTVLVIVLVTKFTHGAWMVVVAIPLLMAMMSAIYIYYRKVNDELTLTSSANLSLPSRIHGIVLVSKLHKPTMRAVYYARATRPSTLEAITVRVEEEETNALIRDWQELGIPVPLKVLDSPFREITRPILDYVKSIRRESPRDVISVFVPQYVVGHWWEQLLHNQSALRLKSRLLFTPGVMVVSVPWQLISTETMKEKTPRPVSQNLRRP